MMLNTKSEMMESSIQEVAKNDQPNSISTDQSNNVSSTPSTLNKNRLRLNRTIASITLNDETTNETHDSYNTYETSNAEGITFNDLMNKKIEDFIVNNLNLSLSDAERIITAKMNLEIQVQKNNRLLEETGFSTKAQELNQKTLAEYQEELLQILGSDNFQKFNQWNQQAEAELVESHGEGRYSSEYF